MPNPTSHHRRFVPGSRPRATSAVSARMPPSPRLSARMIRLMYFSVTMITSAQKMIDMMPKTFSAVSGSWCAPVKHWRSVYSGEVPMSP